MFDRWLTLFGETAAEIFCPVVAEEFRHKSERIAESLKLGLFGYESARAGNKAGC
jgi:hemoglobin